MERLFAVYKVGNGDKVLLGGLAECRKVERSEPSEPGLLSLAMEKFADALDDGSKLILEEET